MPGENAIAKAGRETFDLSFDALRHVDRGLVRHMTIPPKRVLTARRARLIEKTLLRDEHEWSFGMFAIRDRAFGGRNFIHRSAHMHCSRAATFIRAPRNRGAECVIDFKNAGAAPKSCELLSVAWRQLITCNAGEFPS